MANKKKKAPQYSGGYSYDKVVKNKDKNGKPIFFKYEGKKKIRVKQDEYRKVQHTKEYFKKKNGKGWQIKYKDAIKQVKEIEKKQKRKEFEVEKIEKQKNEAFELIPNKEGRKTFANSMATDIEQDTLRYNNTVLEFNGKRYKVDKQNLLNARLFFSDLADVFYDTWHERNDEGKNVGDSPNIFFVWFNKLFKDGSVESLVSLDKTNFSFDNKFFNKLTSELLKKYFGK